MRYHDNKLTKLLHFSNHQVNNPVIIPKKGNLVKMFNHFKIALLGTSVLALTSLTTPLAQAGVDGNPFEGLYLGLNANYAKVGSTNSYTDLDPDSADNNFFTGIGDTKKGTGYGGALYGGIGKNIWGPLYVSIEGSLGLAGGKGTAQINTVIPEHIIPAVGTEGEDGYIPAETIATVTGTDTMKIKAGFAFDINTRLGFLVSDKVMVYGLAGYTSTKYKFSDASGDFSKGAGGYRYGAGFEIGIMEDIAVRIEYVRTEHSAITWERGLDSFRFDPNSQVFRIGVILHMD
ncbi:MAG: hypothetical protein COB54_05685 [Alphaproteobacteria bacterium]|nr:MAG: hypothetical protein COB54_05685 [Alphaproteobacteria bacterium]